MHDDICPTFGAGVALSVGRLTRRGVKFESID